MPSNTETQQTLKVNKYSIKYIHSEEIAIDSHAGEESEVKEAA